MNTAVQQSIDRPVPTHSGPGSIDRAALRLGHVLVEWADRAAQRRTEREQRRRHRAERAHELTRWRAERERDQWRVEPSLLFRNLQ